MRINIANISLLAVVFVSACRIAEQKPFDSEKWLNGSGSEKASMAFDIQNRHVHPTLNSEASYGWIEKGEAHRVLSNSGRTRMNMWGALKAGELTDIFQKEYKTINCESAQDFLPELGKRNPNAAKIKVFTDNAKYFEKLEKMI